MKKLSVLILFILFIGCSKEDDCNCHYSEELNQYIPNTLWHEDFTDTPMTQERLDALAAECRVDGCD